MNIACTCIREHCRPVAWNIWTKPWFCKFTAITGNVLVLAVFTAHVGTGQGQERCCMRYIIRHCVKTILVDFNLAVSTLIAKPPNLIPRQIFQLNGKVHWLCPMCVYRFMTLQPGDVVLTGTPPGVGCFRKPPLWLKVRTIRSPSTAI